MEVYSVVGHSSVKGVTRTLFQTNKLIKFDMLPRCQMPKFHCQFKIFDK
jgi:hypothetical protein